MESEIIKTVVSGGIVAVFAFLLLAFVLKDTRERMTKQEANDALMLAEMVKQTEILRAQKEDETLKTAIDANTAATKALQTAFEATQREVLGEIRTNHVTVLQGQQQVLTALHAQNTYLQLLTTRRLSDFVPPLQPEERRDNAA